MTSAGPFKPSPDMATAILKLTDRLPERTTRLADLLAVAGTVELPPTWRSLSQLTRGI